MFSSLIMQEFIVETLKNAAVRCGLPENSFMSKSLKDNITLTRPRIEYSFLQNAVKRSGRLLGIEKANGLRVSKRELYTVSLTIKLKLFSDTALFRTAFTRDFFYYLPKGINDSDGNYIKFQYQNYEFEDEGDRRIGESVIEVNKTFTAVYSLSATYRITETTAENYIKDVIINPIINKG